MDNEAFRKLVSSGAVGEGSKIKKIARDAVEKEFSKRRKLKGGEYMDSSDEEQEELREKSLKPDKQGINSKKKDNSSKEKKGSEYRDRARERREGIANKDYDAALEAGASAIVDNEMRQFLGGDETRTHLVKGLDVALVQKTRREMQTAVADNQASQKGLLTQSQKLPLPMDEITDEKAAAIIHRACLNPLASESVTRIAKYFKRHYSNCSKSKTFRLGFQPSIAASASGQVIQRSTIMFSTNDDIHDIHNSWELPTESTISKSQYEDLHGTDNPSLTPFDFPLIERLKSSLAKVKVSASCISFIVFVLFDLSIFARRKRNLGSKRREKSHQINYQIDKTKYLKIYRLRMIRKFLNQIVMMIFLNMSESTSLP